MSSDYTTRASGVDGDYSEQSLSLSESGDLPEHVEAEVREAKIEAAMFLHFEALNRHRATCQMLCINFDSVTDEDLVRATLSTDQAVQVERLKAVFKASGLIGDGCQGRREDFIRCVAERAPRDLTEMRTLHTLEIVHQLQLRCGSMAMSPGAQPQAVVQLSGSLGKLVNLAGALDDRLKLNRHGDGSVPNQVHGHLHIHAAGGPSGSPILQGQLEAPSVAFEPRGMLEGTASASSREELGAGEDLGYDLL